MQVNFDRYGRAVSSDMVAKWPADGDLAYFPGCISESRLPEAVEASLILLRAVGARPYVPAGWACCGSPLEKVGDLARLERSRKMNAVALDSVAAMVASCPGCTVQLQRTHGKGALHIIEYLHASERMTSSLFEPDAPARKVALHTPCHLARVVGPHTMEMVRDLLSLVPGATLVEHDAEEECCGGGGGVASSRPEVAARMAARKIASVREAGADLIIAPCPFCVTNLRRAGGVEVEELTTFMAGRLKLRQY